MRSLSTSDGTPYLAGGPGAETPAVRRWFGPSGEMAAFAGFAVGKIDLSGPVVTGPDARAWRHRADDLLLLILCTPETRYRSRTRTVVAAPGDILCLDLAQMEDIRFEPAGVTALAIERRLLRLSPTALDACHETRIEGGSGLGQLLGGHLTLLADVAPLLAPQEGEALSESVGTLAATLLAAARPTAQAEILDLSIAAILGFIDGNLARTDLSPALICRQFGLSRSALYRLFEPIGGIAACIRERRLECARRQMAAAGGGRGSVARLALSVGFPSDAAFARAFRNRYGVAPSKALSAVPANDFVTAGRWRRTWLEGGGPEQALG